MSFPDFSLYERMEYFVYAMEAASGPERKCCPINVSCLSVTVTNTTFPRY